MRVLVVEKTFPWPQMSGSHIRVANILNALSTIAKVDLFVVHRAASQVHNVPPDAPVERFGSTPRPPSGYRGLRKLAWAAADKMPVELAMRDYPLVRAALDDFAACPYDLVWMGRAESFVAAHEAVEAPVIVDLDDLMDRRIEGQRRIEASDDEEVGSTSLKGLLRRLTTGLRDESNIKRWRALYLSIARSVEAVTVCSQVDMERLAVPNAVVVPNGYGVPLHPVGSIEVGSPPTIVLGGMLRYGPNVDAARFFVERVFPLLRRRVPDIQVRLVGDFDNRLSDLESMDRVTLTGSVRDMAQELALADVVVVPVRFGSGTRIKILEAFAHRIPVVSTTLGCEGLGVRDRQHLLVTDGAEEFAGACFELLSNLRLRGTLTESAHKLYWDNYRWDVIAPTITDLVLGATRRTQQVKATD